MAGHDIVEREVNLASTMAGSLMMRLFNQ